MEGDTYDGVRTIHAQLATSVGNASRSVGSIAIGPQIAETAALTGGATFTSTKAAPVTSVVHAAGAERRSHLARVARRIGKEEEPHDVAELSGYARR
jgi:hypothetical protein